MAPVAVPMQPAPPPAVPVPAAPYAAAPVPAAPYAAAPYAPAPYPAVAPAMMPVPILSEPAPPPASGISGLEERKPDLCKARSHSSAIGQPRSVIPSLGLTKAYRIVEYRGIEPQDYDPNRIVFRLDAAGTITNIDCG